MTHDHPPPDTPKILEVLEPFVDFCACQMRFGANDFAHRHDPHRGHGLHDNLVRRDYKISVFKKRIGMSPDSHTTRLQNTGEISILRRWTAIQEASAMAFPTTTVRPDVSPHDVVPLLENGDRLTRDAFEDRYAAMPYLTKAELIEGVVYIPSPVRHRQHGQPHAC